MHTTPVVSAHAIGVGCCHLVAFVGSGASCAGVVGVVGVSVGPTIPHGGQVGCRYVFDGPAVCVGSGSLTVVGVVVVGGCCVGSESSLDASLYASLDCGLDVGHGESGER